MTSFQTASAALFWLCVAGVFYAYLGYPILLWCLARCFGRRRLPPAPAEGELPAVSLLVAAHNEEAVIAKRLDSALAMDYPREKLEIVVASDGSSDATAAIVRGYAHRGVRLLDYKERRGKAAVLNASLPEVNGEIVLLSDANTQIEPSAVRALVRWFPDPEVGVVCGRLILADARTGRNVDGLYWKYETFLKRCEGRLGGPLGANGAIYAIRRQLFSSVPDETIVDDFVIPLQAKLKSGCAIVYDSEAVAREETSPGLRAEFWRRSRIGAGGFQSLRLLAGLLHPRRGWVAFTLFSHKIARWFCPFLLLGALASNLTLCAEPCYRSLLVAQLGFYLVSGVLAFAPAGPGPLRVLRLSTMFTSMNAALLVGFWRWLKGTQKAAWKRTERLVEATEG